MENRYASLGADYCGVGENNFFEGNQIICDSVSDDGDEISLFVVENGNFGCNIFIPRYFEYGTPTKNSTTNYETLGLNVFLGVDNIGTRSVCINDNRLL